MKKEDHLLKLLGTYLSRNGYHLDPKDFRLQLEGNPAYPSLKSVTDTLDYFHVENLAATVPRDAIDQLPKSFMATIEEGGNNLLVEVQQKGEKIVFTDGLSSKRSLSTNKFKEVWNGNVLAVERAERAAVQTKWSQQLPLCLFLIITLILTCSNIHEWQEFAYLSLTVFGLGFSTLIVREELGLFTKSTAKVCNSTEQNTNCSEVIGSKSSKALGIKLSDASVSFFAATMLIVALLGINENYFVLLAAANMPIIAYSIYSQAVIQKQWCPLCLAIALVLTLFSITAFLTMELSFDWDGESSFYALQAVGLSLSSYFGWIMLKPILRNALKLGEVELAFSRFKRSDKVFGPVLRNQPFNNLLELKQDQEIWFGNPSADLEITGVTNPFCGFCRESFKAYDRMLSLFGDKIKLRIIFNVSPEDQNPEKLTITYKLLELFEQNDEATLEAFRSWYENPNYNQWIQRWGKPKEIAHRISLDQHYSWCRSNGFNYTPATLIGEYFFPRVYDISDLITLTQDVIESAETLSSSLSTTRKDTFEG